ncbi:MAG TPA: terminase large subunit, partial [Planctomycetaceae bacterium]|nr:terminase large subunit [Planctomycetaceae bacterium]
MTTSSADIYAKIAVANKAWSGRGMPDRCLLPECADSWAELLRSLPGYDPFATERDGLCFDVARAFQAIGFFHEYLRHIKGSFAGSPLWLERWQQAFIANLFGWMREDGTRRYRRYMLYVPRKNGKTTLIAGVQLFVMLCDDEPGAEVYCGASEREQARLLHDTCKAMVEREPDISERLKCYQYSIVDKKNHASFKVISADAGTKHGFNVHSAIIDELHAMPNRNLYDVLETGTGSRRQPLMGVITTADYERPSVCNELHDHACSVRDGTLDDWQFLPAIYQAERDDDWQSEEVWAKANPNLGVSLSYDYMRTACQRAKMEPSYQNMFLRLHLNIRTQQAEKWLDPMKWSACGGDPGEPCGRIAVGVDIASTEDFAAMATVWMDDDGVFGVRLRFWIPEEMCELRERKGIPVRAWRRDGWLTMTDGARIDYETIRAAVREECERYGVVSPAFDPWNAENITQNLTKDGLDPIMYG